MMWLQFSSSAPIGIFTGWTGSLGGKSLQLSCLGIERRNATAVRIWGGRSAAGSSSLVNLGFVSRQMGV